MKFHEAVVNALFVDRAGGRATGCQVQLAGQTAVVALISEDFRDQPLIGRDGLSIGPAAGGAGVSAR